MNFDLDDAMVRIRDEAIELVAAVEPFALEADSTSALHGPMLEALRASGLCGLTVPAAYGGRTEAVDPLAICMVREVLMPCSGQLDSLFAMQGIGSYPIVAGGTEAQRRGWLPEVASGHALAALALTEPEAGSDLKNVQCVAEQTDSGVQLTGRKSFITNAGVAAFYCTLAKEPGGLSLFLVPADAAGLSTVAGPELIAAHTIGDVVLDQVELPDSARIGAPGAGLTVALATLAVFRMSVGAAAVGLAQRALDEAIRHTTSRRQFGRPLSELGPVAMHLADSWAEIESARLLVYRAAVHARTDPAAALMYSSMAKLVATEAAGRVIDRSVQLAGRYGLIKDSVLERLYRAARGMRIYEGASDVLRLSLARTLTRT